MSQLTSSRLAGVPILQLDSSGAEYSRWRRSIKFVLETKGTWDFCSGKNTMPMPDAGPNYMSPIVSANPQPTLLDERRAWVKQDREVKLDVFLSLAEEVMQDVFEVGPPLPPSSFTAQEMLQLLDQRFAAFNFESYHHTFCHFLNLHIDQYTTIEEFNKEYTSTLEDLLDHGHPLSNTQACSAYLSKLRCTQNPWVEKKLEEWDAEPELIDLMDESPPWSIIRPLTTKPSLNFQTDIIPEETLEDSSEQSDSDAMSQHSLSSASSSKSVPSLQMSRIQNITIQEPREQPQTKTQLAQPPSQEPSLHRRTSSNTARSQEITIHALSDDIAGIDARALQRGLSQLPAAAIPERLSSKNSSATSLSPNVPRMPLPAPIDRPLPPLPPQAYANSNSNSSSSIRSRSTSPRAKTTASKHSSQRSLTSPTVSLSTPSMPQPPQLRLETVHPMLRLRTPTIPLVDPIHSEVHPALRPKPSSPNTRHEQNRLSFSASTPALLASPQLFQRPAFAATDSNATIPWLSHPTVLQRAQSADGELATLVNPITTTQQYPSLPTHRSSPSAPSITAPPPTPRSLSPAAPPLRRTASTSSSIFDLPLQGTRDSAWAYLYTNTPTASTPKITNNNNRNNSYNTPNNPFRDPSISPLSTSSVRSLGSVSHRTTTTTATSRPRPPPAYEDVVVLPPAEQMTVRNPVAHAKSASLDFVARLSADSLLDAGGRAKEGKRHGKKKSWGAGVVGMGMGLGLGRLSGGRGVREMI